MGKESESKGKGIPAPSLKNEVKKAVGKGRDLFVWIRDDGAVCFGDECVVIKPEPNSKDLDIEISPTKCGASTGEAIVEHLLKTIAKGGNTKFTVKSDLVEESKES